MILKILENFSIPGKRSNLTESNFKVQNPSDLCLLLLLVGVIYFSCEEKHLLCFPRRDSDRGAADTSQNPLQIKEPKKGHQNDLLKKVKKEITEQVLFWF